MKWWILNTLRLVHFEHSPARCALALTETHLTFHHFASRDFELWVSFHFTSVNPETPKWQTSATSSEPNPSGLISNRGRKLQRHFTALGWKVLVQTECSSSNVPLQLPYEPGSERVVQSPVSETEISQDPLHAASLVINCILVKITAWASTRYGKLQK